MVINDHLIPKDTAVLFSNEILGRDLENFPNPEEFQPERWLEGSSTKPHPFSVRPFGHGKRICIGKRFADLELKVATAKLVTAFRISPGNSFRMVETRTGLVNFPSEKICLNFERIFA